MKNNIKKLSLIMVIMSTMIVVSSNNWMSMWIGIEINMMSFITYIKDKNKKSSQAKMSYFLIQSISSITFLFTIMNMPSMMYENMMSNMSSILITTSMIMKMGAAPMHMWFINLSEMIKWEQCLILMTWQKISPMFVMSSLSNKTNLINMFSIASILIGAISGINQTSLKKIMALSSTNHLGWMLVCMNYDNEMWIKYLMIYSIIVSTMMFMFKKKSMNLINQINLKFKTKMEKMLIMMMFLSLAGIPPFTGFLAKWIVIESMINNNMKLMLTIMIMSSMLTTYYYMRMMSPIMMMNSINNKWEKSKNNSNFNIIMLINLMLPMTMIMNMI